jgi:hypothetical protein
MLVSVIPNFFVHFSVSFALHGILFSYEGVNSPTYGDRIDFESGKEHTSLFTTTVTVTLTARNNYDIENFFSYREGQVQTEAANLEKSLDLKTDI